VTLLWSHLYIKTTGALPTPQSAHTPSATPPMLPKSSYEDSWSPDKELQESPRRRTNVIRPFELVDWDKTRHLRPQDVVAAEEMLAARHQRLREMPSVDTLFVFRDESAAASTVAVVGSWSSWIEAHDMIRIDNTTWHTTLALPPGENMFKFAVDGRWKLSSAYAVVHDGSASSRNKLNMIIVPEPLARSHENSHSLTLSRQRVAAATSAPKADDLALGVCVCLGGWVWVCTCVCVCVVCVCVCGCLCALSRDYPR